MKRMGVVACLACVAASGLVSTGGARAESGTVCTVNNPVTLSPGLSLLEGSTGTFDNRSTGTVTCDGPVQGVQPTGPGTFLDKGSYGTQDPDDCLSGGEGQGSYTMVLPTAEGERTVVLPFTLEYAAPSTTGGLVGIHTRGEGFAGEFGGTPLAGDCVSAPVTEVLAVGEIVFS